MSSLTGKTIGATYKDILTVHGTVSNQGLEASLKKIEDGEGVESSVEISTTEFNVHSHNSSSAGLKLGGTLVTSSATELNLLDGITSVLNENNMSSNSSTSLATQSSVKSYVDSLVTAQDLDFQGDTGGALNIDLDSESLTIAGGEGIDTVGSGNIVTITGEYASDSNKGIASFTATDFSVSNGVVSLQTEKLQDVIGGMVDSNTESGIAVTYDDSSGKLNFDVGDSTVTLTGDVSGTGTITNLGNVSIATTIESNSLALGTDTTGDYVGTLTAGTGLTSTGATSGEGIAHSFSVDASQTQVTAVGTIGTGVWQGTSVDSDYTEAKVHSLTAGEGIDVSSTTGAITISSELATDTNKGIASFNDTDFSVTNGVVTLQEEKLQDVIGGMVESNTESGLAVTYDDTNGKLNFNAGDPVITIDGIVEGNATMTNLGNVTIDVSVASTGIALGTQTNGAFVKAITAGTGLSTNHIGGEVENAEHTLSVDASQTQITALGTVGTGVWQGTSVDSDYTEAKVHSVSAGEGIAVTATTGALTVSGEDATDSNKGIASFSTANFAVSGGVVTIKDGGVANDELANADLNFSDGSNSSTAVLGGAITISGTSNEVTVVADGNNTLTIGLPDAVTIGSTLTVTQDLIVNGSTVTVDAENLAIEDSMVKVGKNNTQNSIDQGLYGRYRTASTDLYMGMYADASNSNTWTFFKGLQAEPSTTVNEGGTGWALAPIRVSTVTASTVDGATIDGGTF
jgi:hypothetical protein